MKRSLMLALMLAVAVAAVPTSAEEEGHELSLGEALTKGKVSLNLRYRIETVEQSELYDKDAFASTLRTALGYRTGQWKGLQLFVEFEDVRTVGSGDTYRDLGPDGGNGVTDRPVVADPESTDVNQASLIWKPSQRLRANLGRQEILIDNQRFVGAVAWRQNHQSFDAGRLDYDLGPNTVARYAFIGQTNRVFSDSLEMSSHVAEIAHTFEGFGKLRGYAVLLDYDDDKDAPLSRNSYGVSFDGAAKVGSKTRLIYRLETAQQQDGGNNPKDVDATYYRADFGVGVKPMTFKIGYEVLGGEEGKDRFLTPLATLHKFNGWADLFLVTPQNGLEDLFLSVEATLGAWKLAAIWHDFSADSGSASYGSEFDALVVWKLPWKQSVGLKAAFYDADEHAVDTNKVMLWTQWGF